MDSYGRTSARWGSSSVSIMQHWLLHVLKLNPAAPVHTTVALELIGALSRRSLRAALDHIVFRHQILRTVFRQVDGVPVSVVGPADRGLALIEQDVGTENEGLCLLREETRAPFDVSSGPLARARLLQITTAHHFLLMSAHPLICDRASLVLMLRELRDLYVAFSRENVDKLPQATKYADFALHQFETLKPTVLQQQLSYWKKQLLGAQDLARLPTDRPRPATQVYSTQKHRLQISEELTASLSKLADRQGISLLAVLLGGWGVLLNRWSGQYDLTIGVLVSSRPSACTDCLIGQFENILPIRVTVSSPTTVATLLAQIHATLSAAAANQDVPIHAIGESLRTLRDGRPIIQTVISLSHTSLDTMLGGAFLSGELEVARIWEEACESTLEISISISRGGERLLAVVEYAQDLFDKSTIERVCSWWISLFSAMVNTPDSRVSRLTMLTAAERQSVVSDFNNRRFSFLQPQRIDDAFESYAELTPDAVAVVDGARTLSFRELNARANQLARILRQRGTRSGELIAVPSNPGIETIVAAIAVLKAGGAYIGATRGEFRSGALCPQGDHALRMFIAAERAHVAIPVDDRQIIAFDTDADEISRQPMENLQRGETDACDLACAVLGIDFRGQRRWMLLEHRNVTSTVASLDDRLHFTQFDVWSLAHSMTSRIALLELWGALLYGSQVVVVPAGETRDPESLCSFSAEGGATVLNQTPSEFLQWVDVAELTTRHRPHTVILSGEPLRATTLKTWLDRGHRWPQIVYVHGHRGPTVIGLYTEVRRLPLCRSRGTLAGEPLSCSRFYILDRYRQPVSIGVVGDIYVAGDVVARGYTEGRIRSESVPDPFTADVNSKLYKTGDQGYWTAEGKIELVFPKAATNLDVEASRIECELLSHPAVRYASVVVRKNDEGGDSFVAYVEGFRRAPSPDELRTYLELNVPAYLVPKKFLSQGKTGAEQ